MRSVTLAIAGMLALAAAGCAATEEGEVAQNMSDHGRTLNTGDSRFFAGVRDVWVSNDRWVNARTHKTFADDAVRLCGAQDASDQEQAIAIYTWLLRVYGHGGGASEGPRGKESRVYDVWNHVHCYSKGLCDLWGRLLVELWMARKGDWTGQSVWARKVNTETILYTSGEHTQSGLYWIDADGVGRYHLMDAHLGFFVYDRGGTRIASPEEIDRDITLMTRPSKLTAPFFIRADLPFDQVNPLTGHPNFKRAFGAPPDYSFTYNRNIPLSAYRTDFALRKGELLRRQWRHDDKPVVDASIDAAGVPSVWVDGLRHTFPDGTPKDPVNYPFQAPYFRNGRSTYANGYQVYEPELTPGRFPAGAEHVSGLTAGDGRAGTARLHAARPGEPGEVVYRIYGIYPYAESFIEGDYLKNGAGRVEIDFSLDEGKTWNPAWSSQSAPGGGGRFSADIGKGAWDLGRPTTYNIAGMDWDTKRFFGYRYLVRVRVSGDGAPELTGLNRLVIRNTIMLNHGLLPTLVPGRNTITVEGRLDPGCAVRVTYAWEESGKSREQTAEAKSLPHSFVIDVAEKDPAKLRCRSLDVTVVPADAPAAAAPSVTKAGAE